MTNALASKQIYNKVSKANLLLFGFRQKYQYPKSLEIFRKLITGYSVLLALNKHKGITC